ncbi:hypothetical protein [Parasitella parasitica]|uniref:Uncharacterized protein n=1 Tax=Parasitella parasitica TaxID=35722 RepID=A0A0B7MXK8_9FUNG|nr:hypothetical protein [Parasitella parasitica]
MFTEILPGPLAAPVIFILKFILFIAFPMGTLAKEIRGTYPVKSYKLNVHKFDINQPVGLTDLSGAKVVQLKDDLKREFERHYTQRDEHFNRLINERMSDLRQTVISLSQERVETKTRLELIENKFEQLSTKFKVFGTTESAEKNKSQQDMSGYYQLVEECKMMKQEMKLLQEKCTAVSPIALNSSEVSQSFELLMLKIPDIETKTNALETKIAEFDNRIEVMAMKSITAAEDVSKITLALTTQLEELEKKAEVSTGNLGFLKELDDEATAVETKLDKLTNEVGKMTSIEDQPVIKLLLEQSLNTEYLIEAIKKDLKQISTKFNNQIKMNENGKKSSNVKSEADDQALKKEVAKLTNEMKYVNHAIGKLQTVTHEQYRTLLPTVQKVNESSDHLAELAAIVDDITSYHLNLVTPNETEPSVTSKQDECVRQETGGQITIAPTKQNKAEESEKFGCW